MERIKNRNSGIELLKIFAIICIVSHHANWLGQVTNVTNSYSFGFQSFIRAFMQYAGTIGNVVFLISSAWFLVNDKKVSFRKIVSLAVDCSLVSIIYLVIFLLCGYSISPAEILKQFFPLIFGYNWYIGCYILFFMIHPLLNIIVYRLKKEQLLVVDILLVLYCAVAILYPVGIYYNKLIGFICIYFFIAYVKLYLKKLVQSVRWNVILLLASTLSMTVMIVVIHGIFMGNGTFEHFSDRFNDIINPFIFLGVLSLFHLAEKWKHISGVINYISSMSMLIYIIHWNELGKTLVAPGIFTFLYQRYAGGNVLMAVLLMTCLLFLVSVLGAFIYKNTIQRLSHRVCDWIYEKAGTFFGRQIVFLSKFD